MSWEDLLRTEAQLAGLKVPEPNLGRALEQKGWREWLLTLFPFWFEEEFSQEHEKYWELHWKCIQLIKAGTQIVMAETQERMTDYTTEIGDPFPTDTLN